MKPLYSIQILISTVFIHSLWAGASVPHQTVSGMIATLVAIFNLVLEGIANDDWAWSQEGKEAKPGRRK